MSRQGRQAGSVPSGAPEARLSTAPRQRCLPPKDGGSKASLSQKPLLQRVLTWNITMLGSLQARRMAISLRVSSSAACRASPRACRGGAPGAAALDAAPARGLELSS